MRRFCRFLLLSILLAGGVRAAEERRQLEMEKGDGTSLPPAAPTAPPRNAPKTPPT